MNSYRSPIKIPDPWVVIYIFFYVTYFIIYYYFMIETMILHCSDNLTIFQSTYFGLILFNAILQQMKKLCLRNIVFLKLVVLNRKWTAYCFRQGLVSACACAVKWALIHLSHSNLHDNRTHPTFSSHTKTNKQKKLVNKWKSL